MPGNVSQSNKPLVYLTGFMGAGKSTVGPLLAQKMDWHFLDLDTFIEQEAGCSIGQIFKQKGEPGFRKLEMAAVSKTAKFDNHIIALGGGATIAAGNREIVSTCGIVVYLRWPIEVLLNRIFNDAKRPLVTSKPTHKQRACLEKLFRARSSFYERADIICNCQVGATPESVVTKVLKELTKLD